MVTEDIQIAAFKMVIEFKIVGNDIQVHKVKKQGAGEPVDIDPQLGGPPGYPMGTLVKYTKNPICVGFVIGGSYYEICF
jgi:hypothetical protein